MKNEKEARRKKLVDLSGLVKGTGCKREGEGAALIRR